MSDRSITLRSIWRDPSSIYYEFSCGADLEHLLWPNRVLELSCSEGVRSELHVLSAGFLYAFAPLGWCFDAELICELPTTSHALESLKGVGHVLQHYYKWNRHNPFRTVTTLPSKPYPRTQIGLMFSGGVDSSSALIEREEEIDWLIHMSNFDNIDALITEEQRMAALESTRRTAHQRGLGWMHLRTNIASIFKHNRFDDKFPGETTFWLGLEHVHHIATAATIIRPSLKQIYHSGGLRELLNQSGSCAGNADYVNSYTYPAPLRLLQEFELRQHKVERLIDRGPDLLRSLRVCYSSGDGTCDQCRKCQATALMVVAAGGSLGETSFPVTITAKLIEKIKELARLPPTGYGYGLYNEALNGRALSVTREERWQQLLELLRVQA